MAQNCSRRNATSRRLAGVALQNLPLVGYLIGQLLAPRRRKMAYLARYYPNVDPGQWELVTAGQRAQLVTPDPQRIGVLQAGTELVVSADGSIAGLLGASPGASTAVPIMFDLLQRCFPQQCCPQNGETSWRSRLDVVRLAS